MSGNWSEISPSEFVWEREALKFIRDRFPSRLPYHAWSNFEFTTDTGAIYEVDLLVLTPRGLFFIEIKSNRGRLSGDSGTWTWTDKGRQKTVDNPRILANRKVKCLVSILGRQKSMRGVSLPFMETLVFCSAPGLKCDLDDRGRLGVCLREVDSRDIDSGVQGIMDVILPGAAHVAMAGSMQQTIDANLSSRIARAMNEAGIRPTRRQLQVGSYELKDLIFDGPDYQEWEAQHQSLKTTRRRVRIYTCSRDNAREREDKRRAAKREFQLLEGIDHPGVLRAEDFADHELGPALVFEHTPDAMRLDHFVLHHDGELGPDIKLDLIRQIAETLAYAHEKKLYHRALCPQMIYVVEPDSQTPHIKIAHWETAQRDLAWSTTGLTATSHIQRWLPPGGVSFVAPEHVSPEADGRSLDIFSMGSLSFFIFAERPPAASDYELAELLRAQRGLNIAAVLDGAGENLQSLIRDATHPEVLHRIETMTEFLSYLEIVEEELTRPEDDFIVDPTQAKKNDRLEGGFLVTKRLGRGASSLVFGVTRDDTSHVLKLAASAQHNERLRDEFYTLEKLRHARIVAATELIEISGHTGILLEEITHGTLAQRIRKDGRLQLELLERFGEDLLDAVNYLDQMGVSHRDIKPDNIGLKEAGRGDRLHLVLFDFSLAQVSVDNITAGTQAYLDPFLKDAGRRTWDAHAERFAAAMTLHEMATGSLPRWGDGKSDPAVLNVEVSLDSEIFDPAVRDRLTAFFRRALARDIKHRFDTADQMLRGWRAVFENLHVQPAVVTPAAPTELPEDTMHPESPVASLGLSAHALTALERFNVVTAEDLIRMSPSRIVTMRGVGGPTRKEIHGLAQRLRQRFPDLIEPIPKPRDPELDRPEFRSIDLIFGELLPKSGTDTLRKGDVFVRGFLGIDGRSEPSGLWPPLDQVAKAQAIEQAKARVFLGKRKSRWARNPSITALRNEIESLLEDHQGMLTAGMLSRALLLRRGSVMAEPKRSERARAVARAAVETETLKANARWVQERAPHDMLIARDTDERGHERLDYLKSLGKAADDLADADPLHTPARVLEVLQAVPQPSDMEPCAAHHLLELAVAASEHAALSSRLEIYPRGLAAERAFRLAQGALFGAQTLQPEQIFDRIRSRYPEAQDLPKRPKLDAWLKAQEFPLVWRPEEADGEGAYVFEHQTFATFHISSLTSLRGTSDPGATLSKEVLDRQAFQSRLERSIENAGFLVLACAPKRFESARDALLRRFSLDHVDFDALFIGMLKKQAQELGIKDWQTVLRADAQGAQGPHWQRLMSLVRQTMPRVMDDIAGRDKPVLITNAGLIAHYDQMTGLENLRDSVIASQTPPGLWLLLPCDTQTGAPRLNGRAIPVTTPNQWARVPDAWVFMKD